MNINLENDYKIVAENIPGFTDEYSLDEYKFMHIVNESRQLKNDTFGSYNVPFVDLFNHDKIQSISIRYFEDQEKGEGLGAGLYISAKMDIKKGEQLNWHYGDKGNHEFLRNYGFLLTDGT